MKETVAASFKEDIVCSSSDSSCNSTDSSLVTEAINYASWLYFVLDLLIWHARGAISITQYRAICNAFLWL